MFIILLTANTALLALVAHKHGMLDGQGYTFALSQIDYMLGDQGRSMVVGYGNNPPQRPHHSAA